jgi:hypothetical protein
MTELSTVRNRLASRPHFHLAVLGVVVAAAAVVVASLLLLSNDKSQALPAPNGEAALVSQGQLERLASATAYPVYWAGPKAGYSYELTRMSRGRIYVRYLPAGVKAGDPRPNFLVVGTYAQPGSFKYLKRAAKQKGTISLTIADGGIALFNAARPTSVYFTYPGARYQVEVYDPSGDAARKLVLGGSITPLK